MSENESVISAPPPPPEVKVRTMRSDVAAMAKSGGGLPRFESVKVEGWEPGAHAAPSAPSAPATVITPVSSGSGMANRRNAIIITIAVIVAVALAAVGYFVYMTLFAGTSANRAPSAEQSGAGSTGAPTATLPPAAPTQKVTPETPAATPSTSPAAAASSTSASAAPAGPFTHVSLFTKPADQTLTLTLSSGGPAQTAADLMTFNQKLSSLLSQAKKTASLIEIDVVGSDGNGVPVGDILAQEGATVLGSQFLAAHFSPDATFFVYHDANGFWPGYVLSLDQGGDQQSLQDGVAGLESSSAIANFFLTDVGAATPSGFVSSTIQSTPVRVLAYPDASPPAVFVYGWSGSHLILSSSRGGFAAAVAHL